MSGNTHKQRRFYPYFRGEMLGEDEQVFDVVKWMEGHPAAVHYWIHEGQAFMIHNNNSNLADGAQINIMLRTGSIVCHVLEEITGKFDYDFDILENPTFSGGTPIEALNRNRSSENQSTAELSTDVTITDNGTVLTSNAMGEGQKQGGGLSFVNELILKPYTEYIFRFTSRANSNRAHINLTWYEPT